jgi:small subunit ribosomal protein S11
LANDAKWFKYTRDNMTDENKEKKVEEIKEEAAEVAEMKPREHIEVSSLKPTEAKEQKEAAKKRGPRGKKAQQVAKGRVYIKSSFNNTLISITDQRGNVLVQGSAGISGFKGSKKSTPFAASVAAEAAMKKARATYGLNEVEVFVKGVGAGRESAVRALGASGISVSAIRDVTPIPHNGCRAKKPRRV